MKWVTIIGGQPNTFGPSFHGTIDGVFLRHCLCQNLVRDYPFHIHVQCELCHGLGQVYTIQLEMFLIFIKRDDPRNAFP
jgi:hypothetical protein